MADVEVDVSELEHILVGLRVRAENIDRAVVGQILLTAVDDVIQSEGAAGAAGAWDPFAPSTRRRRGDMAQAKLLQDTGLLATMDLTEGPDFMVTSPADYVIFHVEGNDNLPVRDPFDVDQEKMLDEIEALVMDDVERGISG